VGVERAASEKADDAERALGARVADLERQLAEQALQYAAQARQLDAVTRELDSFSYAVAHDLRAPLRAVGGFSNKLRDLHEADLSPRGQHYLDTIQRNGQQLGRLIDGLLACSRVARQPLHRRAVQPREVVDRVLADLRPEIDSRQVDIRIRDLVPCRADVRLLEQVFSGLIANALTFSRGRELAVIEIGSRIEDGDPTYIVSDNGIGFDTRHADTLFGIFQRLSDPLSTPTEGEGIGVGLAICQRIVQRHGGQFWAESSPGHGATLTFTVPSSEHDAG
jgi:light-regulated signal transduction histidine kinase (bacteriophytochrome)